jgi:ubiquinone/menaquinone biosynthesis C-methylase UbiE
MTQSSNYAKFQTRNPLVRRLIDRFYGRLDAIVEPLGARSALDAGCGEGETLARLERSLPDRVSAVDVSPEAVEFTAGRFPHHEVRAASVYELPYADDAFELVLCLEVLEHLDDPAAALAELARVSSADVVVSVPHEPWFRTGSLLRGKYLRTLGDHPEHVNHWSRRTLRPFLESRTSVVSLCRSFPWLLAHLRRRSPARSAPRPESQRADRGASEPAAGPPGPG